MKSWPALLIGGALVLSACASDGYTDAGAEEKLRHAGLSADEAACVVNAMEKRIGANRLGGREAPSALQRQRTLEILYECWEGVSTNVTRS